MKPADGQPTCRLKSGERSEPNEPTPAEPPPPEIHKIPPVYIFLAEACIASAMIYACTTFGLCFFPGVFLHSRVTGACAVTTDFIMRVSVRPTKEQRHNLYLVYHIKSSFLQAWKPKKSDSRHFRETTNFWSDCFLVGDLSRAGSQLYFLALEI